MTETYPEYVKRAFAEMTERFGEDISDAVYGLEDDAELLKICTTKAHLVRNLRRVSDLASGLARDIDREEFGIWKTLVREVKWWLVSKGFIRHKRTRLPGGETWLG